jgi:lipoprotein-releasing system permease protein
LNTSFYIASRYLFAKKKRNAINIISGIAVLAFAVCTAALIIILSTMNGFEAIIFSMYNKFNPDIRITASEGKVFEEKRYADRLRSIEGIHYILPVVEDNAAIRNGDYQTVCTVKGVDTSYFTINDLKGRITQGEPLLQKRNTSYIVMGAGIDHKINGNVGGPFSQVALITPRRGDYGVSDADAISEMLIEPAGVISLDEYINNRYVYVPLGFARQLFERDSMVSALEIKLTGKANVDEVIAAIRKQLGPGFKVQDRMEQQASLYKMFKSEKWASYAILTFILLIAAFNALGSLTMLVIEKKDDIKTLSGMGASHSMIRNIFFTNGFLISGIGAFAGLIIGILLVYLQERYGFITMEGAIIESYPVKLMYRDVVLVASTALGLGLLTGIYPALKSVKGL